MPRNTVNKRTVSNKTIEPQVKPVEVVNVLEQNSKLHILDISETKPEMPKIKLMAVIDFKNFSIGDGIDWRKGTVHEVDFSTFERLMRDDPLAFERV